MKIIKRFITGAALSMAVLAGGLAQAGVDLVLEYPVTSVEMPLGVSNQTWWVGSDQVLVGDDFQCKMDVYNAGSAPATNVQFDHTFPPGINVKSVTVGYNPGVVGLDPNTTGPISLLPPKERVVYNYVLSSSTTGILQLGGAVTSDEPDDDPLNNSNSTLMYVLDENIADLSVAVSASQSTVTAGSEVSFNIHVTNDGPEASNHVIVSSYLSSSNYTESDPGYKLISCMMTKGLETTELYYGMSLDYPISLEPGETATITGVYEATTPGELRLETSVYGSFWQYDPNPLNNEASMRVDVTGFVPQFDLVGELTMSPAIVQPGGLLAEQLVIKNTGPHAASDISFRTDFGDYYFTSYWVFPHDLNLHAVVSAPGWDVEQLSNSVIGRMSNLAAGDSTTVTLLFKVKDNPRGTYENPDLIRHSFTIRSEYWREVNQQNNFDYAEVALNREAGGIQSDLSVQRSAPLEAPIGLPYSYKVRATNLGPEPTSNAYLGNLLPPHVQVTHATADKGNAAVAGNYVSLQGVALAVGESATVDITVVPGGLGEQVYNGKVAAAEFDPNLDNNAVEARTHINRDGPVVPGPELENPEPPCVDMPDLVPSLQKVVVRGKYNKKKDAWTFKIQAKVNAYNYGTVCTMGKSTVKLYLSSDTVLDAGDLLIGSKQIGKLCPAKKEGASPKPKKVSIKSKLPTDVNPAGMYVLAMVDADGAVAECNEFNNITIKLHD